MKRRWKKFLAGVLSAALALNIAAPLALADSGGCTVVGVELTGDRNAFSSPTKITGNVSYLDNTLTFISNEVTLSTIATGVANPTTPLVTAANGNNGLKLVANGKLIGKTDGNGFEFPKEIAGGEYSLVNLNWKNPSTGILGVDTGTTITAGTTMKLDGFQTGIDGGGVQIDGTVIIKTTTYSGSNVKYGIANSTTMNPGSKLEIYAQRFIDKEKGRLTYNGGNLILQITNDYQYDLGLEKLNIGNNVRKFWYRTGKDDAFTEIDTSVQEKLDSFNEVKKTNPAYLELTDVEPNQQESDTYDLWVAGTQVTKTNQSNVLDDGKVSYDPVTNTLTLNDAKLTLNENAAAKVSSCIDSKLTEALTITGKATLSNAEGIITAGPLTLNHADLTLTGNNEYGGEDAIRAGSSDKDISIQNSKVTIAGTNSEGNFFQYGIRCGNLTVADSTLDMKVNGSSIVADIMEASGADTIVLAETDSTDEGYYALDLERLITYNGIYLVSGSLNGSKTAKIARPEQSPDPDPTGPSAYWVVRPGDEPEQTMQIPGAIVANEEEARLFAGWFLEDGTRLEDSPYYLGPDAGHVGNLDRDVIFHGRWCAPDQLRTLTFEDCTVEVNGGLDMGYKADTSPVKLAPGSRVTLTLDESKVTEGMVFNGFVIDPIPADLTTSGHTATFTMPNADATVTVNLRTESEGGSDDFGTILAGGAVVGVAGVVAYEVGTELVLDQLLPADVAVPRTRAELALLLWNTAGRPAPANQPAFADVADPDLASAAQWAIEQGYLNARADGAFKPEKHVAKWRVIRGYKAVTAQ